MCCIPVVIIKMYLSTNVVAWFVCLSYTNVGIDITSDGEYKPKRELDGIYRR
jgi:hypothetical protein